MSKGKNPKTRESKDTYSQDPFYYHENYFSKAMLHKYFKSPDTRKFM